MMWNVKYKMEKHNDQNRTKHDAESSNRAIIEGIIEWITMKCDEQLNEPT